MLTRSGFQFPCNKTIVKKKGKVKRPAFLTVHMIRNNDDQSHHLCLFCHKKFNLQASHDLLQCPSCKDVSHQSCFLSYIIKSSYNATCPNCRGNVPVKYEEEYINTENLEKTWCFDFEGLRQEKEFVCDEKSDDESDNEYHDNEDESEEDEYSQSENEDSEYESEDEDSQNEDEDSQTNEDDD